MLAAILGVLTVLPGCTPTEWLWWEQFAGPIPGVEVPCPEWTGTARVAGFTDDQIPTLSRIMWRESRCDPTQVNPNGGASGLVQIMPMWSDDCGIVPAQLLDPQLNLNCARHVLDVQGWQAWSTYP